MKPRLISVVAVALWSLVTPASAFIAQNGLVVEPQGSDTFSVPWRGMSNVQAFWCAAGDYVRRELNMGGQTRIYRTSGPRHAGQGVTFSLSPEGAQPTGLVRLQSDGPGLSAAHARIFCRTPSLKE